MSPSWAFFLDTVAWNTGELVWYAHMQGRKVLWRKTLAWWGKEMKDDRCPLLSLVLRHVSFGFAEACYGIR